MAKTWTEQEQEQRRREYRAFLSSAAWKVIRLAALARAKEKCEWCRAPNADASPLHVHHKTYKRFGGAEQPEDLQVLCDGCHAEAHGKPWLLVKTTQREREVRKERKKKVSKVRKIRKRWAKRLSDPDILLMVANKKEWRKGNDKFAGGASLKDLY